MNIVEFCAFCNLHVFFIIFACPTSLPSAICRQLTKQGAMQGGKEMKSRVVRI